MTVFHWIYMAVWASCCLGAAAALLLHRERYEICTAAYWRFLAVPWKLVIFIVAATGMTVMAPYTGDPTWDYVSAPMMSLLTYATAPWSIGIIYRSVRRRQADSAVFVALVLWMLSASWCYDGYLVWRDGVYPLTWFSNIFASSVLYVLAGMLWNLDARPGRGVIFAFMDERWLVPGTTGAFTRLFWFALPLIIFAAAMLLPFLWN